MTKCKATSCDYGGDVKGTCKKFMIRGYKACKGCLNRLEETEVILV